MADQSWSARPQPTGLPDTRIVGTGDAGDGENEACITRPHAQLMFQLRFQGGRRRSIQYFNVVQHEYQSGLLRIYCHECTITILGRRLQAMDDKLVEHKVHAFVEQHANEVKVELMQKPYIEKIAIGPPNLAALGRSPAA
jgi:hypothetical protein